jgi:uncharacterized protein YraI
MWRRWLVLALVLVSALGLSAVPAAAQSGVVWIGDYYNNTTLTAPSAFKRQDGAVAFDWGSGSPGSGVNADNFSVRWGADPFLQAGTYRFWVLADDNVKVTVDFGFSPLIDTFGQSKVGQVVSGDITLAQGNHHIQVDYQELSGNAFVYVTWANLATNPTGPNFPAPGGGSIPQPPVSGPWTAQYFANANLSGTPTLIQTETTPTHDWSFGSPVASLPADNFSTRWTSVQTLNAGTYQINVRADDGVRVTIDGVTYINEWHTATGATYTANVNLFAGQHTFMVEYFEAGGAAFLDYRFQAVGGTAPTQPPVITGASITVTRAFRLNVRNAPSARTGQILTKISRNETYAIVGRNSNTSWWQINVNGVVGWVNASYVTATNAQNIPVTSGGATGATPIPPSNCATAPTPRLIIGRLGRVTPGLPNNIRSLATISSPLLGQIPTGGAFVVLGGPQCADGYYWWQVNYNGLVGWTPEGSNGQYFIEPI